MHGPIPSCVTALWHVTAASACELALSYVQVHDRDQVVVPAKKLQDDAGKEVLDLLTSEALPLSK